MQTKMEQASENRAQRRSTDSVASATSSQASSRPLVDELRATLEAGIDRMAQTMQTLWHRTPPQPPYYPAGLGTRWEPSQATTEGMGPAGNILDPPAPGHGRPRTMVPASIGLWKKGGSAAWSADLSEKLDDFENLKKDHSALEDVFLGFESWAGGALIPKDLWFAVFMSYLPEGERESLKAPYHERYAEQDYDLLRKVILSRTSVADAVALYVAYLIYPMFAPHTHTPTQLQSHFNAAIRKLRRATADSGRPVFLDERLLATAFLEAVPHECKVHVEETCARLPEITYAAVSDQAVVWELRRDPKKARKQNTGGPESVWEGSQFKPTITPGAPKRKWNTNNNGSNNNNQNNNNNHDNHTGHKAKKGRHQARKNGSSKKTTNGNSASTTTGTPSSTTTNRADNGSQAARGGPPLCYSCRLPGHLARDCPRAVNAVVAGPNLSVPHQVNSTPPPAVVPAVEQIPSYNRATQLVARPLPPPPAILDQPSDTAAITSVLAPPASTLVPLQQQATFPRRLYKVLGTLTWENGHLLTASILLDTGASPNVIRKDLVPEGVGIIPQKDIGLQAATTNHLSVEGKVDAILTIGSFHRPVSFFVASVLSCPVLLGMDFISEYGISLSYEKHHMVFPEAKHAPVPFIGATQEPSYRVCYARERVSLAPHSRTLVEVVFPAKEGKQRPAATLPTPTPPTAAYFIQAALHQAGLAVPNCVSTGTIEVSNLTPKAVVLDTQLPLAWCYPVQPDSIRTLQSCLKALEENLQQEQEEVELEGVHNVTVGPPPLLPDPSEAEHQLGKEAADRLRELCVQNQDLFVDKSAGVTATTLLEAPIETAEGVVVCKPPYRQGKEQRQATRKMVSELLEQGIISKSTSPWASPICIVKKKDGSPRLCVDFREVNKHLSVPRYPLPRIDDVLQSFEGKKFFSVLDLTSGFWQIPIRKEDRHKTAFVTSEGLFEWNRMPFGLASSPAYFQRLMDLVIQGMKWTCAIAYIDDIIIFSDTLDAHVRDLQQLFTALRAANLKLSPKKCVLGAAEVHYLGHIVSRSGVRPDEGKVRAVRDYPQPKNVTELRRFLGLAQYYHRFIRDFSRVASPLFALLKKGATFEFSAECCSAFQQLKTALTSAPVLAHPDLERPFIIECDASSVGYGACLSQLDTEGNERVVAYASRGLTPTQRKWTATELEAGALIYALETFRTYIMGKKTVVRTDHSPLPWLRQHKDKSYKLTRWVLRLQEFDVEIVHKAGKKMPHVDALSRAPAEVHEDTEHLDEFPNRLVLALTFDQAGLARFVHREDINGVPSYWESGARPTRLPPIVPRFHDSLCNAGRAVVPVGSVEANAEVAGGAEEGTLLFEAPPDPLRHSDEEVRRAQELDRFCVELRTYMQSQEKDRPAWVQRLAPTEMDGLLWVQKGSARPVLVLPEALRHKAIHNHHLAYYAGHFGASKTLQRLKLSYYWPQMKRQVKAFVSRCMFCLTYKPKYQVPSWLKLPMGTPFEILAMDLCGPLPMTARKFEYVLVLVDHHTRWCELVPLRQTTAEVIAVALHTYWLSRYGVPRAILSDNGPPFTAALLQKLAELYGIKLLHSTPYHPRGNSVAESYMRSLCTALHLVHVVGEQRWDELLPAAAMAYRATPHASTGLSPFFLVTGTEMVLPLTTEWNLPTVTAMGPKWLTALWRCRHDLMRAHREEAERLQAANKEQRFPVGAWVGVKLPTPSADLQAVSSKFARKYTGPFRVLEMLPNGVSYVIEDAVTGVQRKVNRVNMKLYALPNESPPSVPDIPPHLLGLPSVRLGVLPNTRETANLQADLPRVAEEVHHPTQEGALPGEAAASVPGGRSEPAPAVGNRRPLRATLARRARAGDPDAHYQFVAA